MEPDPISLAEAWSRELEHASPEKILLWARERFDDGLVIASSFGRDGVVLLDLARRLALDLPVLFLETGYHFPETLAYRDRLESEWALRVVNVRPAQTVAEQDATYGPQLYARDPDACCALRKVDPLANALAGRTAWISGLRRDQHPGRAATPVVQWQELPQGGLFKIHPLAAWSRERVDEYLEAHRLPRHPLWDKGFPSIGCAPCTRAVRQGGAERDGRWSESGKLECGIHVVGLDPPALRASALPVGAGAPRAP